MKGEDEGLMRSQHGQQQQRDDVSDLDHRVHGWACGVFVGVAYGVAGDGSLVGIAALHVLHTLAVHETIFK